MRIGIEVTAAVRQGAGIGRYVRELLLALAELDARNTYRLFFASRLPLPHALPALPANFRARRLPVPDAWLARAWHRLQLPLPVQLATGAVDLYHSPDFTLPPVSARIPTLLTVHDLSFEREPETTAPGLRAFLQQAVPRSVLRATHVLADSQATRDDLIDLYATPSAKITVLYSGVAARFQPVASPGQAAVRAQYALGAQPFVLCVGTLHPRKNHLRLIAAFYAALRHSEHNLVIVGGPGGAEQSIRAAVQQLGLQQRVLLTGYVADAHLPALYSAAHAVAYPSLYEGFGLPLAEALACGTPVLASTAPCLPEVAGGAALLADPRDEQALAGALLRITSDADLRADLRARGLQRAAAFSWQAAARQLLALYTQLA